MAKNRIKNVGKENREMKICRGNEELHAGALAICFILAVAIWFYMVCIGTAHGNSSDDKQTTATDTSAGMNDISETDPMTETTGEIPAQAVAPS